MKRSGWMLASVLMVAALAACSGDDDDSATADAGSADSGSSATSFACENGTSADQTRHACSDFVYTNIPTSLFETAKMQCTLITTARVLTACDRTGVIGGCTKTEVKNGITTVTTTWQYSGTPTSIMGLCATQAGYTYVSP